MEWIRLFNPQAWRNLVAWSRVTAPYAATPLM